MPLELAADIAGANFFALQKPDGGIRPIAVGETLRRLVSKCLCAEVRDDARDLFHRCRLELPSRLQQRLWFAQLSNACAAILTLTGSC